MSPWSPLAEDHLAAVPVPWHRDLRYFLELALLEISEDLGAREQAGGSPPLGMARIMPDENVHSP